MYIVTWGMHKWPDEEGEKPGADPYTPMAVKRGELRFIELQPALMEFFRKEDDRRNYDWVTLTLDKSAAE